MTGPVNNHNLSLLALFALTPSNTDPTPLSQPPTQERTAPNPHPCFHLPNQQTQVQGIIPGNLLRFALKNSLKKKLEEEQLIEKGMEISDYSRQEES